MLWFFLNIFLSIYDRQSLYSYFQAVDIVVWQRPCHGKIQLSEPRCRLQSKLFLSLLRLTFHKVESDPRSGRIRRYCSTLKTWTHQANLYLRRYVRRMALFCRTAARCTDLHWRGFRRHWRGPRLIFILFYILNKQILYFCIDRFWHGSTVIHRVQEKL